MQNSHAKVENIAMGVVKARINPNAIGIGIASENALVNVIQVFKEIVAKSNSKLAHAVPQEIHTQ
jgi:hypothetical protein